MPDSADTIPQYLPGREVELGVLEGLLRQARAGTGGVAYIEAGMGMGKTRLLTAADTMACAAGMARLSATGRHAEREFSCGVIVQLLAQPIFSADTGARALCAADPVRRLTDRLHRSAGDVDADWFATFHGLFAALCDFTRQGPEAHVPLAILVDDASAADVPSQQFLAYLAARMADLPIALVVVHRRGEPPSDRHALSALRRAAGRRVVCLGDLPPAAAERVVHDTFPHAGPSVVRAFGAATARNPLLLAELLTEAKEVTGESETPSPRDVAELLPATVINRIDFQLTALPTAARDLARAVAALGGNAPLAAAEAAAQLAPGTAARYGDALAETGLILPGAPLRIAAPLVHRALARSVRPLETAELRRRAAAADRGDLGIELARLGEAPSSASDGSGAETQAQTPLPAARVALDSSIRDDPCTRARELAELAWRGVTTGDPGAGELAAACLIPQALLFADELERAEEILVDHQYQRLAAAATDSVASDATVQAWTLYHQGQIESALSAANAAREALTTDADAEAHRLRCAIAACCIEANLLMDAERVLAVTITPDAVNDIDRLLLLDTRARLRLAQERAAEALDDALAAGRLSDAANGRLDGVVSWRSTAALAHLALDQRPAAASLIDAEVALAHRRGSTRSVLRAARVQALVATGRRRLALLAQAVALGAERPTRLEYMHAVVDYGSVCRRANQRAAARELLREALELCNAGGATALAGRASAELAAIERPASRAHETRAALTRSERRVADLAAQGLTTRQIATTLFVTPKTVEFHLRHVYHKLQIPSSRAELMATLNASGRRSPVETSG